MQARAVGTAAAGAGNGSAVQVVDVRVFEDSALPYQGRYPSGSLYLNKTWYYGTYTLAELDGNAQYPCGNWCVQGPFVGFRASTDGGRTWDVPRMEMGQDFSTYKAEQNLFGELGPVCKAGIIPSRNGSKSKYTCAGEWVGKVCQLFGVCVFVIVRVWFCSSIRCIMYE